MRFSNFIYLSVLLFVITSCTPKAIVKAPEKVIDVESYQDRKGRVNLIGEVNQAALEVEPYKSWYTKNLDNYFVNPDVIEAIKSPIQEYEIEAYFGTWCGDSKRDVPKFYKILDETNYDLNRLLIVAVGNEGQLYKKSTGGETEGKNISNVPTFIFYKDGVEVNRIVESAVGNSLEEDVMKIVTGQPYRANYAPIQ